MKHRPSLLTANNNSASGFSIMEIMVAMSLFLLVVLLTGTTFSLAQRSYATGATRNELSQNIRVYFDRISRELRQASNLVTDLSLAPSEIEFQDGHDNDYISYVKYYLLGNEIHREQVAYYFDIWEVPRSQWVRYSDVDAFTNSPTRIVLKDEVIGEYFNSISFTGQNGLITITAELEKGRTVLNFDTKAYIRNW